MKKKWVEGKIEKPRRRFWLQILLILLLFPLILFSVGLTLAYSQQDRIVQKVLAEANQDFEGFVRIEDSHIEPFLSFPFIAIDFEGLHIYEGKNQSREEEILHIKHCYVDFNIWDVINSDFNIKGIKLSDGFLRLIQHKDGSFNVANALKSKKPASEENKDFKVDLKSISMANLDIIKINESNNVMVDVFVQKAQSKVKSSNEHFYLNTKANFTLTLIKSGDTSFLKNKHFELATELDVNNANQLLTIKPTVVKLENSDFEFSGKVGLDKDVPLDLYFKGEKPNFDLIIAIAPEEIAKTFRQFDNQGKVFFQVDIKGKSANGNRPEINATFGCENAYLNNKQTKKTLDKIGLKGSFTNGKNRDASTMKLDIQQFSARPEAGLFLGKVAIENFDSPDINIELVSDFDLEFIAKFVNAPELTGLAGKVKMTMNFHDIIDLTNPEKAIEKLNESYFTELEIENLRFDSKDLPAPIKDVDVKATLKGHAATIEYFKTQIGNTDVNINGSVSDLPALIHHTNIPVICDLNIQSNKIDLRELTKNKEGEAFNEHIDNLSLKLKFLSSAKKMVESKNLPEGEFFIQNFYAKLNRYPHVFHDFNAEVLITEKDFKVIDFHGYLDQSDFHFNGFLRNYDLWLANEKRGETYVEFDLESKKLKFDNLFAYGGENYVPEDYRHEEIDQLKFHGRTHVYFNNSKFIHADLDLSNFTGKMKIHPLKFENFSTTIHLNPNAIDVKNFTGKMGRSDFKMSLHYNFNSNKPGRKNNFSIVSGRLDLDELTNYNPPPSSFSTQPVEHDAGYSLYDLPFTNMDFSLQVDVLNYHRHTLNDFKAEFHTTKDHTVQIHRLDFVTAEGEMKMKGQLSGKDKRNLYFSPVVTVNHIDLDKLMLKFNNFGQDFLVSDNLHGYVSGTITGKIRLHADLVPKIDDSKIVMDLTLTGGKLERFAPLLAMEHFFEDKNVSKVSFDTLRNKITYDRGTIYIPNMTINSTLGFLQISGMQKMNETLDMDYEIGVPWKMIGDIASKKLFRRKDNNEESEDEIMYKKDNSRFVYITVKGGVDNYEIKLGRRKRG